MSGKTTSSGFAVGKKGFGAKPAAGLKVTKEPTLEEAGFSDMEVVWETVRAPSDPEPDDITNSPFWVAVVFPTREHRETFLDTLGLEMDEKYIDVADLFRGKRPAFGVGGARPLSSGTAGFKVERTALVARTNYTDAEEGPSAASLASTISDADFKAFRANSKNELAMFALMTDSEHWLCLCFRTAKERDVFPARYGLPEKSKHVDGFVIAKALGVKLPPPPVFPKSRINSRWSVLAMDR